MERKQLRLLAVFELECNVPGQTPILERVQPWTATGPVAWTITYNENSLSDRHRPGGVDDHLQREHTQARKPKAKLPDTQIWPLECNSRDQMARKLLKYWSIFELECNLPGQTPILERVQPWTATGPVAWTITYNATVDTQFPY